MKRAASEPEFNPYAAPLSDPGAEPAADLFRIVSTRVSLLEYWRIAAGPITFFIVAIFRILHVPTPFFFPWGLTRSRHLNRIELEQMPPHVRRQWEGPLAVCEGRALQPVFAYSIPVIGSLKEAYALVLRSEDGLLFGSVVYARSQSGTITKEVVTFTASSRLADGRRVATMNTRPFLKSPPELLTRNLPKLSAEEVLTRHLDWVAASGWTPVSLDAEELPGAVLQSEQRFIDFQVDRGVLAPMTTREAERLARLADAGPPRPKTRLGKAASVVRTLERVVTFAMGLWLVYIFAVSTDAPRADQFRLVVLVALLGGVFTLNLARFVLTRIDRNRSDGADEARRSL